MATVKRRSIVEFEKWLDGEIKRIEANLVALDNEAAELTRHRTANDMQLRTLQGVKTKLAPVTADEDPGLLDDADVSPATAN